jgi:hypothetical protein
MEISLDEIFQKYNDKIAKMQCSMKEIIEEEVSRRVNLRSISIVETMSKTYGIPVESLMKDLALVEDHFCKGINGQKVRCLKKPKENGYCGFHQKQVPAPKPKEPVQRVPAPWEET